MFTMVENIKYREPGVAGSYYSRDKMILERELSMFIEAAPLLNLARPIRGIVVPHSGYLYSGGVAARAYSQLVNSNYRTVIILSPTTTEKFNFCSIFPGIGYSTPLGEISIDRNLAKKLIEYSSEIKFSELGHSLSEHTQEVQLPFLQWCLGKFQIVPLVIGNQNEVLIEEVSQALVNLLSPENTLLVASSDLSHQYPLQKAKKIDQNSIDVINEFDDNRLLEEVQDGLTEMTGFAPVIITMKVARKLGASTAKVLLYRNSGDINGDYSKVDGYLSAVIY
jgi:AmmeMemoRadiSam system protein B